MNKPVGVVSTCNDPWNRKTVLDLLPSHLQKTQGLHPVGRLDAASTGALLLSNDGAMTFALTHPSHAVSKTYHVWVKGNPNDAVLRQWRQGIVLDGKLTLPAAVEVLDATSSDQTMLKIVLKEGRNRQIRRVAEQLGYPVVRLHRIAIGSIQLGQLSSCQYRHLQQTEVNVLKETAEHISQLVSDRVMNR